MTALFGGAVLASVAVLLLRRFGNEGAASVTASVALVCLLGTVFLRVADLLLEVEPLFSEWVWEYVPFLFKVVGVAWLAQIASDLCREMGSATLGGYVELFGRIEILLLCLPLVKEVLAWAQGLVG